MGSKIQTLHRCRLATRNEEDAINMAMDEYAQQMAIEFADFCISNTTSVGFECEYWIYNNKRHTTSELYQIFLNEKQK